MAARNHLKIITDERFFTCGNRVFALSGVTMWSRYLDVFDSITLVARMTSVPCVEPGMAMFEDERIDFIPMPYYVGLRQFLRCSPRLFRALWKLEFSHSRCLIRAPSTLGTILYPTLRLKNVAYTAEVVGDPEQSLQAASIGLQVPMLGIIRRVATLSMGVICRDAHAISYVTRYTLQEKYPSRTSIQEHYSSIILREKCFRDVDDALSRWQSGVGMHLLFVGSLEQRYKGLHVLLDAIRVVFDRGLVRPRLTVLGDGKYLPEYQAMANDLGIQSLVDLRGNVSSKQVFSLLSESDLFVLPSLTEGLPRALIEAMAHSVLCVASKVGGVPELLDPEFMFEPGDVEKLVVLIGRVNELSFEQREAVLERNRLVARGYHEDVLYKRRNRFYRSIAMLETGYA